MAGAFFEVFVIAEIIKSYYNKGIVEPPLYFYRDKDMDEIDLVIEENGTLYPLEMKKHIRPMRFAPLGGCVRRLGEHNLAIVRFLHQHSLHGMRMDIALNVQNDLFSFIPAFPN